ncbi:magnesium transporter [Rhodovulum sp. ES.010]|uniref:magnesium transporter n=1 Tax=Rhodovulum sp. ES.010 TaxID=1882821 RepID=UPI000926A4D0|nr:magnesium transporter [Rhodovulum sp. ES.010]SIO53282.1 magnesium transporter [Rhodovulum sp. ES.010]
MSPDDTSPAQDGRETAQTHLVASVPTARPETRAADLIAALGGQHFDCADTILVTDADTRLIGIVRINDLFANAGRLIGEIMEPEHEAVTVEADQEEIATLAIRLNMIVVPVVDETGRLIGAVPPEALFRILRDEHMEDLQRLAGIGAHQGGPAAALDAPIRDRLSRRLPWLVLGLAASTVVTLVMVGFEEALAANVAVAFFVPALVYIAGAIGTQAVSVSVRALSTSDVALRPLMRDEALIGLGIGAALGTIAGLGVLASFGDGLLALAVGLAVLGGGAVSSVVGFALPWAFQRIGSDPAMGSGPICTVIQDAASLAIYFLAVRVLIL